MAGTGARRKVAYKRKLQNRSSMFLVLIVVVILSAVVGIKMKSLSEKRDSLRAQSALLQEQIDAENARTEEIEEFGKYTQTKKYAEEVAKEKLGLVYEDEILFLEED